MPASKQLKKENVTVETEKKQPEEQQLVALCHAHSYT